MTKPHRVTAAAAAEHLQDLAKATDDACDAYQYPAEAAATADVLREAVEHLAEVLSQMDRYIRRNEDDWQSTDDTRRSVHTSRAQNQLDDAKRDARSIARFLERAADELKYLAPKDR
ncbi:hypothetical protein [Streptomyces sp. NPDC002851]